MLHIRRLQGLDSHVHVNKAIGFLNTPKLSFPCCRNPRLWLVWSQLNKCAFPGPKTVVGKKKLIVDDFHSFPNQTIAEHREASICWQGFLYKITLVLRAVGVAKFHWYDDSCLWAKPITWIKISIGKLEFKWAFLSPLLSLPCLDIPAICVKRPLLPLGRFLWAWTCHSVNVNGWICSVVITSMLITSPLSRKSYSLSIELHYTRLKSRCFNFLSSQGIK